MVHTLLDLNPLEYQVWGKAGVLLQAETETKNSFQVYRCTLAALNCLIPEEAVDNAVKDYFKRLQACVSANGGNFEHIM